VAFSRAGVAMAWTGMAMAVPPRGDASYSAFRGEVIYGFSR
jgi:hypothetical protein